MIFDWHGPPRKSLTKAKDNLWWYHYQAQRVDLVNWKDNSVCRRWDKCRDLAQKNPSPTGKPLGCRSDETPRRLLYDQLTGQMIVALTEGEEYVPALLLLTVSVTGKKSGLEIVDLVEYEPLLTRSHVLAPIAAVFLPS